MTKYLLGYDASGLEARTQAHYILPYPGGPELAEMLTTKDKNNDVHTSNAKVFGTDRNGAKPGYYGALYGCSLPKFASIIGKPIKEAEVILDALWDNMPAMKLFKEDVIREWKQNNKKYIQAIDGRVVFTRSEHSLVNAKFQSCGSIAMRLSVCLLDRDLHKYKGRANKVICYHDESQIEVDESLIYEDKDGNLCSEVGDLAVQSVRRAGEVLKLNAPLDAEYKIGKNWSNTH